MNITLHQFEIFRTIARTSSITKAAAELHLTQPAVSIQLRKIQDQFDIPLTETIGRQLHITDFGKEIALAADRILAEVDQVKYRSMEFKDLLVGQLKVSIVSTAKYAMPYFLSEFLRMHPAVELTMDVTNKARVVESLAQNEVDFSMVSVLPDYPELNSIELMKNKLFLVGRPHDKFKSGKTHKPQILSELPLIYREKGSATRQSMQDFIEQHGIEGTKQIELTSNEATKQSLIAGLGYSIMPLIGIKNDLVNGELEIIPVKGLPIITNWQLVWLKQKKLSPVARAFLEYLDASKQEIIDKHFDWYEDY